MDMISKEHLKSYDSCTHDTMTQHNRLTYANRSTMDILHPCYGAVRSRILMAFQLLTFLGFLVKFDVQ